MIDSIASKVPDLAHLRPKLPTIPANLFQELKTSNFGRLNSNLSDKAEFSLSDYLNAQNSIMGFQIPLPFKTYLNFESACHEHYDLLIGTRLYRQKVGEYYNTQNKTRQLDGEILQNRQRFNSNRQAIGQRASSMGPQNVSAQQQQ